MGDPVLSKGCSLLPNKYVLEINRFWKRDELYTSPELKSLMKCQIAQEYFRSLLKDTCLVIGMRSGVLESGALNGVKTIYVDDRRATEYDAGRRMEKYAGSAGSRRKCYVEKTVSGEDYFLNKAREVEYQGPIPNYKRFVTNAYLGNTDHNKRLIEDLSQKIDATKNKFEHKFQAFSLKNKHLA